MNLACCSWALSGTDDKVLRLIADAGFSSIDVRPFAMTASRQKICQYGLSVSCLAASFGMPEGRSLNSEDGSSVTRALEYLESAMDFGAELGASTAYVVPDGGPEICHRYGEALSAAADLASRRGMKLCVEHFPGKALDSVAATLSFLRKVNHPNLFLLFDSGHAQISGEDPGAVIMDSRKLLGYVHLDDNDAHDDLHLGLTEGIMTESWLQDMFLALADIGYSGAASLELSSKLPDPLLSLVQSKELIQPYLKS